MQEEVKKYLRLQYFPHIWCPGCGNGIILQAFLKAVHKLGIDQNKLVAVSGIGCSSRSVGYIDFDTLHTAHGRAIPFATGIKLARPDLTVVILAGDGDMAAIGGGHLIHAARRNIDLTVILFNNFNYGMTNGQYSPLTPLGDYTMTSPYGNVEPGFDICEMVKACGATYITRSTTYHAIQLPGYIAEGIENKGFSLIEVISGCPTYHGKWNDMPDAVTSLEYQRDHAVNVKQYQMLNDEERADKFAIGRLHSVKRPEYTDEYLKVVQKAQS